ncbi:MAG: zf-TFIIB domain-containing protein [Myxococcaceae bacterium]
MSRRCPGCADEMQVFFVRSIEVDRCLACGGTWFDCGELERVLEKPLTEERFEGHTERRCPVCTLTLTTVFLPSAVPAEACTSCRGLYLDDDELETLADGRVGLVPKDSQAWKRMIPPTSERRGEQTLGGFLCVKCGGRFSMREGHHLAGKLACAACLPTSIPLSEATLKDANRSGDPAVYEPSGPRFDQIFSNDDLNIFAMLRELWAGLRRRK